MNRTALSTSSLTTAYLMGMALLLLSTIALASLLFQACKIAAITSLLAPLPLYQATLHQVTIQDGIILIAGLYHRPRRYPATEFTEIQRRFR